MEKREQGTDEQSAETSEQPTRKRQVSDQHRSRISESRAQGRAINDMVNMIRAQNNGAATDGRRKSMSLEDIEKNIIAMQSEIETATGVNAAKAAQKLLELQQARTLAERVPDTDAVRIAFIEVAAKWSKRNRVSYEAWRLLGVGEADLQAAGITSTT